MALPDERSKVSAQQEFQPKRYRDVTEADEETSAGSVILPKAPPFRTKNLIAELREHIRPFLERLSSFQEVEGVVVLSSLAMTGTRPFADEYSDVDLALFLNTPDVPDGVWVKRFAVEHQEKLPVWLPNYRFSIPGPFGRPLEINVHQLLVSHERAPRVEWPESMREAYLYTGEVVYDRHGEIRRLINEKTTYDSTASSERLIWLAVLLPWYGWIHPPRMVARGLVLAAHDLLIEALDLAIEGLFILNSSYRPHRKWRLMVADRLPIKPTDFGSLLRQAMTTGDLAETFVASRSTAIRTLWDFILETAIEMGMVPKDYDLRLATHLDPNRQLRTSTVADRIVEVAIASHIGVSPEDVRGIVNFCLAGSPGEFIAMLRDTTVAWPSFFRDQCDRLRSHVDELARSLDLHA